MIELVYTNEAGITVLIEIDPARVSLNDFVVQLDRFTRLAGYEFSRYDGLAISSGAGK